MANNLSVKPWKIDTVSATPLYFTHTKITFIEYVGYSNAAHSVEIQDSLGNIIAVIQGNTDLSSVKYGEEVGWVRGFAVLPTQSLIFGGGANMQSGMLLVYIQ